MRKPPLPEKTRCLPWLLGLAALWMAFHWEVIFRDRTIVFLDASRFFYPLWKWGSDVLKQGMIPLWNPDAGLGAPYFADPQMAYGYPPVPLFFSILQPLAAFNWLILLHHLAALAGFFLFARGRGLSALPAFFGSLAFGFSLHLTCSSWTPVALFTMAWIPWIFLLMDRLKAGKAGSLPLLSMALAFQMAAGYPVLAYLTGLGLLLELLLTEGFKARGGRSFTWMLPYGLAYALAVVFNLAWGLPFWEFYRLSNYTLGSEAHMNFLGWDYVATLLSPFIKGHPIGGNYVGVHYWVATYFMGLPAFIGLVWAMARGRAGWVLSILFFLALALSMGEALWLGGWLKIWFPGYSLVIRSGFWLSMVVFWGAFLSARGLEGIEKEKIKWKGWAAWAGICLLVYGAAKLLGWPLDSTVVYGADRELAPRLVSAYWISLGLILAAALPLSSLASWRPRLAIAALVVSLGTAALSLNFTLEGSYYREPSKLLAGMDKEGRLFHTPPVMAASILQGDDVVGAFQEAKERIYANWPLAFGRQEITFYNTIMANEVVRWHIDAIKVSEPFSQKVADYLNMRYCLGGSSLRGFRTVSPPGAPIPIAENPTALPRWFSVPKVLASSGDKWKDWERMEKEGMDFSQVAFSPDPSLAGSYHRREVKELKRSPQSIGIMAAGQGRACLVSSETLYPGWRVNIVAPKNPALGEGRVVKPGAVNQVFRSVVLDEAEDAFILEYQPATFRLGLFLALLVCGIWAVGLFRGLCGGDS